MAAPWRKDSAAAVTAVAAENLGLSSYYGNTTSSQAES
jgi:hypothetical protein